MKKYVLDFRDIDQTQITLVGGKGANLGELSRVAGIRVPAGFCVTTDAFERTTSPSIIPDDIAAEITKELVRIGEHAAYAVRSSATAEDLPTASFAGLYDSFLNVTGRAAVLEAVGRCWASLNSERAVGYRVRNGFDDRKVRMAVVVQRMVDAQVAGVLFTAHPISGNRKVSSIEAVFGLGEALVSGTVNADAYAVRNGDIIAKTIRTKPTLTDAQVVRLEQIGRRIETHFGRPQDIEWCLADDEFHIVQSRPITTLFPIPVVADSENHIYLSVGHQQMMTDAVPPLGLSMRQLINPIFAEAGGRWFVDATRGLAPATRSGFLAMMEKSDPLTIDAIRTILDRRDFLPSPGDGGPVAPPAGAPPPAPAWPPIETDPAIVAELIAQSEASIDELKRNIRGKSGPELLDFILADFTELKRVLFNPRSQQVYMSAMDASHWLNDHLQEWLGEKNAADTLTLSVSNNVTSEMGLQLLNVADVIRPHPAVVAFLEHADDGFLDELPKLAGGREAQKALRAWLDKYGVRCVGEIDITRPRWIENPTAVLPILLGNIRNFEAGEGRRRFDVGLREARDKEASVLSRLRALPDGEQKADETKRKIDCVRTFIGYREYPKYDMVCRYFIYKVALMEEAERLVRADVIREKEDIFYLRFEELHEAVRANRVDHQLVSRRKEEFRSYQSLTPPRVLTSEGESIVGSYRRNDVPHGALPGLAVSVGTVEGRARVIRDIADADFEPGDILVTPYTDPSWTPLFVAIKGLVTEVGGLMTHGAVIAREYGLPAVVGVVDATRLIRDGQRIRVHGTEGYVSIVE